MRVRPIIDFTKGLVEFKWKTAAEVELKKSKPTPIGRGVRGRKANQKNSPPKAKKKSYIVDV